MKLSHSGLQPKTTISPVMMILTLSIFLSPSLSSFPPCRHACPYFDSSFLPYSFLIHWLLSAAVSLCFHSMPLSLSSCSLNSFLCPLSLFLSLLVYLYLPLCVYFPHRTLPPYTIRPSSLPLNCHTHTLPPQRNWLRHSGVSLRCRTSCSRRWMRSGRAVARRACAGAAPSSTSRSRSAARTVTSKTWSWPSASSTSASSCCRTTRSAWPCCSTYSVSQSVTHSLWLHLLLAFPPQHQWCAIMEHCAQPTWAQGHVSLSSQAHVSSVLHCQHPSLRDWHLGSASRWWAM